MGGPIRYLRLFFAFARFGLATEMAFRANFLVKIFVEMLWLGMLLMALGVVSVLSSSRALREAVLLRH